MKSSLTQEQIADLYADLLNEVEELIEGEQYCRKCEREIAEQEKLNESENETGKERGKDMETMSEFKLPKGARWLKVGEIIKAGDKVYYPSGHVEDCVIAGARVVALKVFRICKPRKPHRFDGMRLGKVSQRIFDDSWRKDVYEHWTRFAYSFAREVRRRDKLKGNKQ